DRDTTAAGDQFVSVEDSMGQVHASRGRLRPPAAAAVLALGRSGPAALLLGGGAVAAVLAGHAWAVLGRAGAHR
ncbi:hypothetical protein VM98_20930, partial [Streptomyces rubellomurinus subsp. indigoferus]